MDKPQKNILAYLLPFLILAAIIVILFAFLAGMKIDMKRLVDVVRRPTVITSQVETAYQKGDISILRWGKTDWEPLGSSSAVNVGDALHIPTDGRLVLRFPGKSELRFSSSSSASLVRFDNDQRKGNHVAVELTEGTMWGRVELSATQDADVIVTTPHQVVQASQNGIFSVSVDPESTRVMGGTIKMSLSQKVNGNLKPLGVFTLNGGEQLAVDSGTLQQLKEGQQNIIQPVNPEFLTSEWFLWNDDIEKSLGYLVDPSGLKVPSPKTPDFPLIQEGLVNVTEPSSLATVGPSVRIKGAYDSANIDQILVNGSKAIKSLEGEWEARISLSTENSTAVVTAVDKQGVEYLVMSLKLNVQDKGPELLKVTFPVIDENGNAQHDEENMDLKGEVSSSAARVCVAHNAETSAYCLKAFKPGDSTWRYVAGVSYGNLVVGQNKYIISAYDTFENITTTTVYIFHKTPKPSAKVEETSVLPTSPPPETSSIARPIITAPTATGSYETSTPIIKIFGTVATGTESIFVNDTKIRYDGQSTEFNFDWNLEQGENLLKLVAVSPTGQKSKVTVYRVTYTKKEIPSTSTATP